MNATYLFKRNRSLGRTLHKALTICLLASLLAGLIPPPALTSLANSLLSSVLPEALAKPAAELADAASALLPAPSVASAQSSFFTLFIEAENFSSRAAATGLDTDAWTQVADGTSLGRASHAVAGQ